MNKCECDKCEYCSAIRRDTRKGFYCEHPNQRYINDYFKEKDIQKMPGFVGFGEKFADVPKNKTTPKWCPKKAPAAVEGSV